MTELLTHPPFSDPTSASATCRAAPTASCRNRAAVIFRGRVGVGVRVKVGAGVRVRVRVAEWSVAESSAAETKE